MSLSFGTDGPKQDSELLSALDGEENRTRVMDRKDQEILSLKRALVHQEQETYSYKIEYEKLQDQVEQMSSKYETLAQEGITQQQNIQLLTDEKRFHTKKLNEMEFRINLLIQENEKLNTLLQDRINQTERLKTCLDRQQEEQNQIIMQMKAKFENTINEKFQLHQKEKATMESNHVQVIQFNKKEYQRQVQIIHSQFSQLKQAYEDTLNKSDEDQLKITQLNEQNHQLKNQLNDLRSQQTLLKDQNQQLRENIVQLKEQHATFKEQMLVQREELHTQLSRDLLNQSQILRKSEFTEQERLNYQQEIEQYKRKLMDLEYQLQQYQHSKSESRSEIMHSVQSQDLEDIKAQLEHKTQLINFLEESLQEIHSQIYGCQQEREQLRQQNQTLRQQLHSNQQKMAEFVDAAEKQEAKLTEYIHELQRRVNDSSTPKFKDSKSLQRLKQYSLSPLHPRTVPKV